MTFIVAFIGLLPVSGAIDFTTAQVALAGGVAAALSLIKNLISQIAGTDTGATWWQDMLMRTLWTYVQTWIGVVVVNGTVDFHSFGPAAIACIPAALTVIKSYLASKVGDPDTAGFTDTATGKHAA